jgi:hypothetical protein
MAINIESSLINVYKIKHVILYTKLILRHSMAYEQLKEYFYNLDTF